MNAPSGAMAVAVAVHCWHGRALCSHVKRWYHDHVSHQCSAMLQEDVARLSRAQDGRVERDKGLVAVVYEQGLVPARRELSLPIPTPHGLFAVAFPTSV